MSELLSNSTRHLQHLADMVVEAAWVQGLGFESNLDP